MITRLPGLKVPLIGRRDGLPGCPCGASIGRMRPRPTPPQLPEGFQRPAPSPADSLPPRTQYRRGLAERFGDDAQIAPTAIYAFFLITPVMGVIGFLLAGLLGIAGAWTAPFALGFGLMAGLGILFGSMTVARRAGKTMGSVVVPSGASTPYERQFSSQEALAAHGRVDEALMAYETELQVKPHDLALVMKAADLYLEHKQHPERAAELLRQVRRIDGAPPEKVLYASHRLVDLYLGPLNDRGRAIVELRVIIDRFPNSQAAAFARDGLLKLKREHHEDAQGA